MALNGETMEQAAIRIVSELAGVTIILEGMLGIQQSVDPPIGSLRIFLRASVVDVTELKPSVSLSDYSSSFFTIESIKTHRISESARYWMEHLNNLQYFLLPMEMIFNEKLSI